jgi:uncharacterized protein YndB with AHSA1/START domain/DNA-binding transcriptional ArsR family regulator
VNDELEPVFRALADAQRRRLLDRLRERDGQALNELEPALPGMTRFGVMKHLRVLESAALVVTRRQGRRQLHILNPVPIQLIADRWISRYAAAWVGPMTRMKHALEATEVTDRSHSYEIYVRSTADQVWKALTDPQQTRQFWHGALNRSGWETGSPWTSDGADGTRYLDGEIIEADAPHRLVQTFHVVHRPEAAADPPSRLTWEISPMGDLCRLRVLHEQMGEATEAYVRGGWEYILSGLKTLLETGQPMPSQPAKASA